MSCPTRGASAAACLARASSSLSPRTFQRWRALGIHLQVACPLPQHPQHRALILLIEPGNRHKPALFDEAATLPGE
jgi:hypothetical protein